MIIFLACLAWATTASEARSWREDLRFMALPEQRDIVGARGLQIGSADLDQALSVVTTMIGSETIVVLAFGRNSVYRYLMLWRCCTLHPASRMQRLRSNPRISSLGRALHQITR
jgi:hypothetical protein